MTDCPHRYTSFDRTICADPCGSMHTYCEDCGKCLDDCPWSDEPTTIEVSRSDLLRSRARLLEEMPVRFREGLKNIDHLLGWPPK